MTLSNVADASAAGVSQMFGKNIGEMYPQCAGTESVPATHGRMQASCD
jgi:hypothetical protein